MITTINTFKIVGLDGVPVTVETEISNGIGIHLVGLADISMKESLLRTVTAMQSYGYIIPGKKVIINLAPADLTKSGVIYDLPIALGIIGASGQKELSDADKYIVAGELDLTGLVREIDGWMQAAELAKREGKACILPTESAKLAAAAFGDAVTIYGVQNLREAIDILAGNVPDHTALDECVDVDYGSEHHVWDLIRGHEFEKRALEIAVAGGHPVLLMGAPGSGKSLLARAARDILPVMTYEESMEVQSIYSACGKRILPGWRPFRSVEHYVSMSTLMGGGIGERVTPGSASLAHNGVLYFDQFNIAPKAVQEAMRIVMEDKKVTISRLKSKVDFPTDFLPVIGVEPCPCGYYGEGDRCKCTEHQRELWLQKMYGPVYDRLTMQMWAHPSEVVSGIAGDPCFVVAERVRKAREVQVARQGMLNDNLGADAIAINDECQQLMDKLIERLGLSARAYTRILKIAKTIADLDGSEDIKTQHVAEAASYRFLDSRTI